ncbi:MAG: hypothetical protein GEU74_10590 [Nitriliruptorales bacterium]|nr:hypothetical protein [Nitriliruptorales bacterium]
MTELHDVALVDFPVARYAQMQQHHDALLREFALIATDLEDSRAPRDLLRLANEIFERYGDAAEPFREGVAAAVERGDIVTTLKLSIPNSTLRWTEDFLLLFEEADEYCARGDLLTPAAPPEVVAFRRWMVGELIRQIRDGASPSPYWSQEL